jgi:hypothetical protein
VPKLAAIARLRLPPLNIAFTSFKNIFFENFVLNLRTLYVVIRFIYNAF